MKILVLSDSHSSLSFMRRCMAAVKPNAVIHLGDYYEDACALEEEYSQVLFCKLPGNCDRYRTGGDSAPILCPVFGGVRLYLTHGHLHRVKSGLFALVRDARQAGAAAALYGHTHEADLHWEEDGLLVLNPGSCGYYGGSAAILEVRDGRIVTCKLIRQEDLEEML